MQKKMLIDATHPEETRVVVVDGTKVEEFDFEAINKRQLAGNIYLAKVTRVEPSLQAAFVDYGGNRHGFLAFAEIHPDYYQIPAADRQALIEEERAEAAAEAEDQPEKKPARRRRSSRAERVSGDAVAKSDDVPGMEIAHSDDEAAPAAVPAQSGDDAPATPVTDQAEDAPDLVADADTDAGSDADHAGTEIELLAEEDTADEIRPQNRKPRHRRYKIQEVIKVRQIMLVQVVKEERGNKGAALTTYLSLAGRYCVLMPNTARGGGISRKITNVADRKKLKEIASELEVPQGAGLIIRTAGSQRTRTEIKRDYEYLMRLWEQIRELTFKSVAPAPVYEEGDLIKRTIRDIYSKDIDEVLVEGERGYRTAKDFMKMIMPSHAKNVKHYADPMPLFSRFQVESYLTGMFNPVVQLKSGGYLVIGVTEALVAIDVNSGRATREGSIEDTAFKTNCEAADEIARQLRLRDLAGLIVIDFIDMEERKNNATVEKRFKDHLKSDRARIQVGRISGFGLLEMSRQRLRPGMLESTTQPCPHCHGTGLIRSDDSLALTILRAVEEEGTRKRSREVLVRAPVAVVNFLINAKREHVAGIEARYGMAVRVEADAMLISPDFTIEKFKTATRALPEAASPVVSVDARLMAQIDDEEAEAELEDEADEVATDEAGDAGDGNGKSRRRRRRRRRSTRADDDGMQIADDAATEDSGAGDAATVAAQAEDAGDAAAAPVEAPVEAAETSDAPVSDAPAKPRRTRARRKSPAKPVPEDEATAAPDAGETPVVPTESDSAPDAEPVPEVATTDAPDAPVSADPAAQDLAAALTEATAERQEDHAAAQAAAAEAPQPAPAPEPAPAAPRPKRRGWWSAS